MIENRSHTAPCSREHSRAENLKKYSRLSSARNATRQNTTYKLYPSPSLNAPRSIPTSKYSASGHSRSKERLSRRTKSAPPSIRPQHSNSILNIRGKHFDQNCKGFDLMSYLKGKSFPRRIQRLINENPDKNSEVRNEEGSNVPGEENDVEDSVVGQSLNNEQLLERRRGLHLQRSMNRSEARAKILLTFHRVLLICRVKLIMTKYSIDLVPATKKEISWSEKRHTREAAEVLFSKSLYQKQPMIYSHVPKWAETILRKHPDARSDREIMQIHAMMQGLVAYDKFTRRIQIAMCRSMTFLRIKYPRVILRKGHIGLAFYFIFSGSVFINIQGLHVETNEVVYKTVSILQRGDAFGEVALLRNISRTASVAVKEDVELMVVDKNAFGKVCSEIYDREMREKMEFCRQLPLFKYWKEEAIKRICQDSQIHEYKANKIIVQNKADEEEWIYFCMEGQCRVIKPLEFNARPRHSASFVSRRLEEENCYRGWYLSLGVTDSECGRNRSYSTEMEIMNELRISIEQIDLRRIARAHILDDDYKVTSRNIKEKEEKLKKMGEAEEVLFSFGKNYNHLPHCTGEAQYCLIKKKNERCSLLESSRNNRSAQRVDHVIDLEKTTVKRRNSIELTTLLNNEISSGRLNTRIAYLNIATMQKGEVFNLSEVLQQTGRQLILVSLNAKILQIKKQIFFKYATKESLLIAKILALENNYPDDDALYYTFREKCLWEEVKTSVLQQTVETINVTHRSREEEPCKRKFTAKERAKSAREVSRKFL